MARRFEITDFVDIDISQKHFNFAIEYSKDFNARRAAAVCGYSPDSGYSLSSRDDVQDVLNIIASKRVEASHIDAEWVLMEAVDNHMIARQNDNITASNTALGLIAKHTLVDAMASDKMNLNVKGDKDVMERLMRARARTSASPATLPQSDSENPTAVDTVDQRACPNDDVSFF